MRSKNLEKLARICWNTKRWASPSGLEGKSDDEGTWEWKCGYGHEEWLLDYKRTMPDGYHYGNLQELNNSEKKHVGAVYNIHLYTVNPQRQDIYVGCLYNAVCISKDESKHVYEYYKSKGWLKEMKRELAECGGSTADLNNKEKIFNVKFKFEDADLRLPPLQRIEPGVIPSKRYVLMDMPDNFRFAVDEERTKRRRKITHVNAGDIGRHEEEKDMIIERRHKEMQNYIATLLKKQYDDIRLEEPADIHCTAEKIDIVARLRGTDEWHYFELKTNSAKISIREALGQILEYAHYYHTERKVTRLYIVGPSDADPQDRDYLNTLRQQYGIPLWYRWYSFDDNKLYPEV